MNIVTNPTIELSKPVLSQPNLGQGQINVPETAPSMSDYSDMAVAKVLKENPYTKNSALFTAVDVVPIETRNRYNDPIFGFSAKNPDIEQDYADRQGTWDIVSTNLGQGMRRGLATFLGGFADFPDAAEALSGEGWNAFNNTSWKNSLVDWSDAYSDKNPIYANKDVEEASLVGSFFNPLDFKTFATRWSTLANNLGFTIGAIGNAVVTDIAVGALTGGVGEAFLLPKQARNISSAIWNLGKSFEAGKSAANLAKILSVPSNIIKEIKTIGQVNNAMNATRFGLSLFNSAVGEGSVEGYQNYKETKQALIDDYTTTYGVAPDTTALSSMEETAKQAGATTTLANTALLMATNYVTFGRILNPTSAALRTAEKAAIKAGVTKAAGSIDDIAIATTRSSNLMNKFWKGFKPMATTMATEGFEEGSQFTIGQSTKDYYTAKYRGSEDAEQLWKSFTHGISETLGTREGLDNIVMGALSGAVIHGGTSLFARGKAKFRGQPYMSSETAAIKQAVEIANSTAGLSGSIRDLHGEASTQSDILKRLDKAVQSGNVEEAKNLKADLFFSWIHTANKSGLIQLRLDALDDVKNLTDEEFANFWGIDYSTASAKTASSYLSLLKQRAIEYAGISDSIEVAFGKNPFNGRKDSINYQAFEDYKEALAHSLMITKDSERRIDELTKDIAKTYPTANVNSLVDLTNKQGIENTIETFNQKIIALRQAELNAVSDPILKKHLATERQFLEKQIESFQELLSGKMASDEQFKETFIQTADYLNSPLSIGQSNPKDQIGKEEMFEKLNAIEQLKRRALEGAKYYLALRDKNGFKELRANVNDQIRGAYTKRIRLVDGKFKVVGRQELAKEALAKVEELTAELNKTMEAEIKARVDEQLPEFEIEDITNEQNNLIDDALTKIQEGREEDLTEAEREVLQLAPKAVEKKKVEQKVREEVMNEELTQQFPAEATPEPKETRSIEATKIDNLLGNVYDTYFDDLNEEELNALKKAIKDAEGTKMVSALYTKYILNSPIFKFIFGEKFGVLTIKVKDIKGEIKEVPPTKIKDTKFFRSKNVNEAIIYVGDKAVGYMSNSANMWIEKDGQMRKVSDVLSTLTEEDTGYTKEELQEFKTKFVAYHKMSQRIFSEYKQGQEVIIPSEVALSLIALQPSVMGFKASYEEATSTLLKDIKALGKNSYIISVKHEFRKQPNGEYASQRVINVIGDNGILSKQQIEDDAELAKLMNNQKFIDNMIANNRRYHLLNRLPNGKFSATESRVVGRPQKLKTADIDALFSALKENNLEEISRILSDLYIADNTQGRASGVTVEFLLSPTGEILMSVVNKKENTLVAEVNLSTSLPDAATMDDLLIDINEELAVQMDKPMVIKRDDFKLSITDDRQAKFSDFMDKLQIATTPYFFNQIRLTVIPRESLPIQPTSTTQSNSKIKGSIKVNGKIITMEGIPGEIDFTGNTKDTDFSTMMPELTQFLKNWDKDFVNNNLVNFNGQFIFNYNNRVTVFIKVGNFIIPYYFSSKGTSGKAIDWHYIFGVDEESGWIIKGYVGDNGEVEYSKQMKKLYPNAIAKLEDIKKEIRTKLAMTPEQRGGVAQQLNTFNLGKTKYKKSLGSVYKGLDVVENMGQDGVETNENYEYLINASLGLIGLDRTSSEQITNNSQTNTVNNLVNPNKMTIFAVEYDTTNTDAISKARALQLHMREVLDQLKNNKTIQETTCK